MSDEQKREALQRDIDKLRDRLDTRKRKGDRDALVAKINNVFRDGATFSSDFDPKFFGPGKSFEARDFREVLLGLIEAI